MTSEQQTSEPLTTTNSGSLTTIDDERVTRSTTLINEITMTLATTADQTDMTLPTTSNTAPPTTMGDVTTTTSSDGNTLSTRATTMSTTPKGLCYNNKETDEHH